MIYYRTPSRAADVATIRAVLGRHPGARMVTTGLGGIVTDDDPCPRCDGDGRGDPEEDATESCPVCRGDRVLPRGRTE